MDQELKTKITERLKSQQGHVGFYYKNMVTGETMSYKGDEQFLAASVIKLPIFMCICKWAYEGKVSFDETIKVKQEDKMPICGALTLFTGEPGADILTLCKLMISISDNTATNLLIKRFGIEALSQEFKMIGLKGTRLNRLLFDAEATEKGIENTIVPDEMGMLLEKIYSRTFVDSRVSKEIEDILFLQQINHKICGIIGDDNVPVAHKTGEDDDLSNDVGIVYAKQPFIVCFAGHDTKVSQFEDLMRHVSADLYRECNR